MVTSAEHTADRYTAVVRTADFDRIVGNRLDFVRTAGCTVAAGFVHIVAVGFVCTVAVDFVRTVGCMVVVNFADYFQNCCYRSFRS